MGACFSCFKGPPPPDPAVNAPLEKDREEIKELCPVLGSREDVRQSLQTVVEAQVNGNSKGPVGETCGSLHRAFYPRIQALGSGVGGEPSEAKLDTLFEQYRDSDEDCILADGIERLCADLCVPPDDFRVLVLAWRLDAERMCRFTRSEFIGGCRAMRVDSLRAIRAKLPELSTEAVKDPELFKDLYRFTFRFGLDAEAGQRILPSDVAICLWRLVFSTREPPVLERWLSFLECHPHVRGIPRDTWNMFLNFSEAVGDDLGSYDDTEAWPSLFDDFVEFENDKVNQNLTKDEEGALRWDRD